MLVDTHCHINFKEFKDDVDKLIIKTRQEGVSLIVPSVQKSTSQRAIAYAHKYDNIWAAVGLHPTQLFDIKVQDNENEYYTKAEELNIDFYRELARDKKVVAIGEVGLDYYQQPAKVSFDLVREKQKRVFQQQLKLAQELSLPVIIHTRMRDKSPNVYQDVLELLDQAKYYNCVLHSFTGSLTQAQEFIALGCYLSFNGIITYKNADNIREIVKKVYLKSILIETDAPYLAPEPHRGKRNEPSYVKYVAEKIAEIKKVSFEEVAKITTENANRFFNLI